MYALSLDSNFAPFLADGVTWGKKTKAQPLRGFVNEPQRKGLLPQYARNQLLELQHKFDDLEAVGVFRRREDVNIIVEYLNPSFLVK